MKQDFNKEIKIVKIIKLLKFYICQQTIFYRMDYQEQKTTQIKQSINKRENVNIWALQYKPLEDKIWIVEMAQQVKARFTNCGSGKKRIV